MGFKENFKRKIIDPHISSKVTNAIGRIVTYDSENNTASVVVSSSGVYTTLVDVPIQISGRGVMSSNLKIDDLVYIQYNNSSVFQPKIVGFADENYKYNTRMSSKHERKGCLLNNITPKEGEVIPRVNRRVDENDDGFKYMEYRNAIATEALDEKIKEVGFFGDDEVGLFHPVLSSVVKLKDNGDIDIFTGTNTGIRINKKDRTIEIFGNSSTISENWKVLSKNAEIISEGDLSVKCKSLKVDAEEIEVNGEILNV